MKLFKDLIFTQTESVLISQLKFTLEFSVWLECLDSMSTQWSIVPTVGMHCTLMYYTVLYCTVLYCTALHLLHCTVLHCTHCIVVY